MIINLNDTVMVKLTKYGKQILTGIGITKYEVDESGYARFTLWFLMNTFGSYLFNGCVDMPFSPEVKMVEQGNQIRKINQEIETALDEDPNTQYIDLEKDFWESIKLAADESEWIPKEHYFMNDWVADVIQYLKKGK